MKILCQGLIRVAAAAAVIAVASPVVAQQKGGVLRMYHRDSPASMSIHEEATFSTLIPIMGVMNNLVMYDQNKPQNSLDTIVPDLATSWNWSKEQARRSHSSCARASNGTTASRSRPRM